MFSKIDPEIVRTVQRWGSVALFIWAVSWLKMSPEALATVAYLLGGMGGNTFAGSGQVDVESLKKLARLLESKPPSVPPPPP